MHLTCSWFLGWDALYLGITHACMVVMRRRQDEQAGENHSVQSTEYISFSDA